MGAVLRMRRKELGLSLSEAARRAEVSPSYLSAVEGGGSVASLPVLARIAHALDATIGEILAAETSSTVEVSRVGSEPGMTELSSPALRMRIAYQHSATPETGPCPFDAEGASLVVYVWHGLLEVTVDGESWRLHEGDALHATEPGRLSWSTDGTPTTAVWAVVPST